MAFLKDEEKNLLLDHYVDIEWPDDASDFRCVCCHRVAIYHHVSNCKHVFCHNCKRELSDGGHYKCPQCQQYVIRLDAQDINVEFQMQNLRISCPNKRCYCKYEDQLRNMPKHLMTCVNTLETSLLLECTGTNIMDAVVNQMSKVNATIGELKERMYVEVKKIDDMDNKLNVWSSRMNDMEKNSEEIKSASEECKDLPSINSLLVLVKERVEHNELIAQQTMKQMSSNMERLRTMIASMTKEMETLHFEKPEELHRLKSETYEWTLKDVAKTILKDRWSFESQTFNFTGSRYEIRAFLVEREGKPTIYLEFKFMEDKTFNKITMVKYIVKDQRDILNGKNIIGYSNLGFHQCIRQNNLVFECTLPTEVLSPPYMKNDCIKMTILFEPPSIDRSFVSNNGVLKWRVDNYETLKGERFHNHIWSPTFYTSPQGYRVAAFLNLDCKGAVRIDVQFLTGEHDDSLSIKFPHKTTVTLFNHLDPSKNLVSIVHREDISIDRTDLGSKALIEQNGYIKNDSLIISIAIEPVLDPEYDRSSWITIINLLTLFFLFLYIMFNPMI